MDEQDQPQRIIGGQERQHPRDPRQELNILFEDEAGRLERKARDLRIINGLIPQQITREQFNAMLQLVRQMR